jgi:hypothetical protein
VATHADSKDPGPQWICGPGPALLAVAYAEAEGGYGFDGTVILPLTMSALIASSCDLMSSTWPPDVE